MGNWGSVLLGGTWETVKTSQGVTGSQPSRLWKQGGFRDKGAA